MKVPPFRTTKIEQVQTVLTRRIPFAAYPFLKVGQRVRIRGGSLDGVEGILLNQKSNGTLIISVNLIQRSLAVSVTGFDLEPVYTWNTHATFD